MKVCSWDIGIKNLAYCLLETESKTILEWKLIDLNVTKKDSKDVLCFKIFEVAELFLQNNPSVDVILIENQPCLKTPIMKSIQMILFTTFLYITKINNEKREIKFVSPINKLRYFEKNTYIPENIVCKKKKAIYVCEKLLSSSIENNQKNKDHLDTFNSAKKKDDLSDSFLYCMWFSIVKLRK